MLLGAAIDRNQARESMCSLGRMCAGRACRSHALTSVHGEQETFRGFLSAWPGGIIQASNHVSGNDKKLQNPAVRQLQDEGDHC